MSARLTTRMLVSALLRRVQAEGGNGAVLHRGDDAAGALLISCVERGVPVKLIERQPSRDGRYCWAATGPELSHDATILHAYIARRRAVDPDLWLIELDVPSAERFAAEISGDG
jgi:hypothetical protein